jgi:secreted trypsin-like serine protease
MPRTSRAIRWSVAAAISATVALTLAAPSHAAGPTARAAIVGGQPAASGGYIAALLKSDTEVPLGTTDFDKQFCGGSLIDARTVLTAAHCVFTNGVLKAPYQMEVLIGRPNLLVAGGRKHAVAAISPHPAYNPATNQYDLARITLAASENTLPVAVIAPGQESLWPPNTTGYIAGWGALAEGGPYPSQLQIGAVPIRDDQTCINVPGQPFDPGSQLCAGYPGGGIDTCQGDSGGPLFISDPVTGRQTLLGVTSFGRGCGRPQSLGIYARLAVPAIHTWVVTGQLPASAPPPAPAPAPVATPAAARVIFQAIRRRGGSRITIRGRTVPVLANVRVNVQRRVRHRWVPNGYAVTRKDGTFSATLRIRRGRQRVRLVIAATPSFTRAESSVLRVRVR